MPHPKSHADLALENQSPWSDHSRNNDAFALAARGEVPSAHPNPDAHYSPAGGYSYPAHEAPLFGTLSFA